MKKHYAIFKQKKMRKMYGTRYKSEYESLYRDMLALAWAERQLIDEHLIWEGEIPNPKISPGEQIYIEEISKVITVGEAIRTTSDKMFYYINDIELVEDEISIKSKEKALKEIKDHNSKYDNEIQQKKWYQFWR